MDKSKKAATAANVDLIDISAKRLKMCVEATESSLQNACASALEAGLHLLWLKQNIGKEDSVLSVPCGTLKTKGWIGHNGGYSLREILEKASLKKTTAYRWMNATRIALGRLGYEEYYNDPDRHPIPGPMEDKRGELVDEMRSLSRTMTLSRLMLGSGDTGDIERLEVINTKLETAENEQEQALYETTMENVEMGKWSLIQAMRAVGSQEAADVAAERRANVVYCDIDPVDGRPIGVAPKAIVSLANSLRHWGDMSPAARDSLRHMWRELATQLPEDF